MKSDVIIVTSKGAQTEAALKQVEKVAEYKDLSHKNALHLRLLTEEAMGLMRAITGNVEGKFWIEEDKDEFKLHLQVETDMDENQRKQLISASSSGQNEAAKGIMGKIRSFFEPEEGIPMFIDYSMVDYPSSYPYYMDWSLREYERQVQASMEKERKGAAEAWDELEKSVISHLADDVKVSIKGRNVEMTIYKKMA